MSCNGCRVLRKGCSDNCVLRQSLQWIETAEAQGHATVFVAKFFGRAGLMSFISAVPDYQRPALFESLLYEAAGRTVNPVNGAVGLLWTGNWNLCQAAVETVFRGGTLRPIPEFLACSSMPRPQGDEEEAEITCAGNFEIGDSVSKASKRRRQSEPSNGLTGKVVTTSPEKQRRGTPSMNSEDSETTTVFESGFGDQNEGPKLLNLFN